MITQTSTAEDRNPRAFLGLTTFAVRDYMAKQVQLAGLLPVPPFSEGGYFVNVLKESETGMGMRTDPRSASRHRGRPYGVLGVGR